MPGPIIEELPDDYDVAAEKSSSLRRGFFSKRETPKKVEKAPEVAESASPGAEPSTERSAEVDDMPEAPSQSSGPSMGQQLQNAIAGARGKLQEASRRASQEEKALEAALGPLQARWPTSQMKEKQVKATKEIDNALAEMRMSLNDARRHRSGEERRALTELQKVAEDVVERVQKVADQASANHSKDAKELQQQTLLAFHALPFTVKLRILMAEKAVAVTLLGGAFTVGPWKSDLQRLQRRPWNQHPAPAGRPICDPAATMTPLVAKATETAMRRALAWQPWLISKVKSRVPVEPPESESEDEVPMEDLTSSRTLRRHPKSSETMTTSLDAEFARSLKANFDKVFSDLRAEKRDGKHDALISSVNPIRAETHAIPLWQLHKLARDMNMSLEKVVEAKEIFDAHDEDRSGRLSFDEITRVIETLMERQVSDDATVQQRIQSGQSKQLLNQWLRYVPQDNLDLDFEDFLLWYSCTGFMTDLLVDEKEKRIRTLAKVNGLDAMCMDRVRRSFTSFDLDRSGEVDEEEFENVLREVMNIPPHLQIPPSRIRFFWKEIDEDDSGKASFHEFLNFWLCRFGKSAGHKGQLLSIEDYYRSTRRMGAEYLDPPPELDEITEAIQAFIANLST